MYNKTMFDEFLDAAMGEKVDVVSPTSRAAPPTTLNEAKKAGIKKRLNESRKEKAPLVEWVGSAKTQIEVQDAKSISGSIAEVLYSQVKNWFSEVENGIKNFGEIIRQTEQPGALAVHEGSGTFDVTLKTDVYGEPCIINIWGRLYDLWESRSYPRYEDESTGHQTVGYVCVNYEHPKMGNVNTSLYFDASATVDEVVLAVGDKLGGKQVNTSIPAEDDQEPDNEPPPEPDEEPVDDDTPGGDEEEFQVDVV